MEPLVKTALLRTLGFFLLISLGLFLFLYVEHTEKDDKEEKYQLLRSLYESMASKYNMTIEEFNNFSNLAFEALSVPKPRWTYLAATDFVVQAITTIGYGYITPQTPAGQLSCIVISLLGIPITLLALKSVGELIAKLVSATVTKFEKKIFKRAEPKQIQTKSAVLLFSLMIGLMTAAGFLSMTSANDWTFVNGMYFWFITFSTIGFGDYTFRAPTITTRNKKLYVNDSAYQVDREASDDTAGQSKTARHFIFVMFMCFYLICLCLVSSVVNSIMFALEEIRCRPRCSGCFSRKAEDDVNSGQCDLPQQRIESNTFSMTNLAQGAYNFGFQEGY